MKIIRRSLEDRVEQWLFRGKIISIFGARQVGKTTMVQQLLKKHGDLSNYYNCDIPSVAAYFENPEPMLLSRLIGNAKLIVIDEAQRVKNIGLTLKVLHDTMPRVQIITTGSSSFHLGNALNEALTGRGMEFLLFPFSLKELEQLYAPHEIDVQLPFFLRFGLYPEITDKSEKDAAALIQNLSSKYLYRDILELENLKKPELLTNLLQLIALQLGSEVSRNEIAHKLHTSRETIERYLDLLEKSFVIYRLKPLSKNRRKEIVRKEKIYFYDTGIRNAIINSFQDFAVRNDIGALFENFMIIERLKHLESLGETPAKWFWRTHDQKEIDYVEEKNGMYHAFEFKWSDGIISKSVRTNFLENYPSAVFTLITGRDHFRISSPG
ncbi:MAG: ATP-binding protein [Spirochaetaceae bacterium]